jgi:hypothetical protein
MALSTLIGTLITMIRTILLLVCCCLFVSTAFAQSFTQPLTVALLSGIPAAPPDSVFISEIMFNVPKGTDGDANHDGTRDASGDEFVEIFNPTAKPIQLGGYSITSRLTTNDADTTNGVRFTFPEFELPAGAIAVVFNGYKASIPGNVGTPIVAPKSTNAGFAGAFVFTMNTSRKYNTFANNGDFCLLSSPKGRRIDCVVWGEPDPAPPGAVEQQDVPKDPRGSVQRADPAASFHPHRDINADPCSPGEIPPAG